MSDIRISGRTGETQQDILPSTSHSPEPDHGFSDIYALSQSRPTPTRSDTASTFNSNYTPDPGSPGVDFSRTENASDYTKGWNRFDENGRLKGDTERTLYASIGPEQKFSFPQSETLATKHADKGSTQIVTSGKVPTKFYTSLQKNAVEQSEAKKAAKEENKSHKADEHKYDSSFGLHPKGKYTSYLKKSGLKTGTYHTETKPAKSERKIP